MMITVTGSYQPMNISMFSEPERAIFLKKDKSPTVFYYDSVNQLEFELKLRVVIMESARALSTSKAEFASFNKSRCNAKYWLRDYQGGFQLKESVQPSAAIKDIFTNGFRYAFECATAMVIILYKAILGLVGDSKFDALFPTILLFDWHYEKALRLIVEGDAVESFQGDILYFKNPDVTPSTPEWQGENVVKLGNNLYYGHGIGIKNAAGMIADLNKHRVANSSRSAYLLKQVAYPDFKDLLALITVRKEEDSARRRRSSAINAVHVSIGSIMYIRRGDSLN